jgi:hypothetical protein
LGPNPTGTALAYSRPGIPDNTNVLVRPFARDDLLERLHVALHSIAA